jgi:hypothetical protein
MTAVFFRECSLSAATSALLHGRRFVRDAFPRFILCAIENAPIVSCKTLREVARA